MLTSRILNCGLVSMMAVMAPGLVCSAAWQPDPPSQTARTKLPPEQQGDLFMARKMFREAVEAYREAPQTSPVVWDKIGIAYHQLGDLNAAKKSYEKAVKLDPKYADAINNVGTILYSQKNYRGAITRYNRALVLAPETASIWSNLGTAYYARGKYAEMSQAYAKAMDIDPGVFESHNAMGTTMQDRSVTDKARYHFEMARIYAKTGKNDMAMQYLRKALEEGFKDKDKVDKAPEFAAMKELKEFKELMALEPRVL